MRTLAIFPLLCLICACSSGPAEPPPEEDKPLTAEEKMELEKQKSLSEMRTDLREVEGQLQALEREREVLDSRDPSEEKIKRLQEIGKLEIELKDRRRQLRSDIARLEGRAEDPADADSALDMMGEEARTQEEDREERIRVAAEEKERQEIEEAARKKKEEMERMKREAAALQAESRGMEMKTGPIFEEKWADVIMRVRAELQKYRRW